MHRGSFGSENKSAFFVKKTSTCLIMSSAADSFIDLPIMLRYRRVEIYGEMNVACFFRKMFLPQVKVHLRAPMGGRDEGLRHGGDRVSVSFLLKFHSSV